MRLTESRHAGLVGVVAYLLDARTVEDRGAELQAEPVARPSENGLVNLSEVHTGRHAERVQHDVHRSSVLEERHILLTHDLGHDTLVAVTARHLVTNGDFALLGDVDLGDLHHAVRKLVSDLDFVHLTLADRLLRLECDAVVVDEVADKRVGILLGSPLVGVDIVVVDALEHFGGDLLVLGENLHTVEVGDAGALLVLGQHGELLDEVGVELLGLAVVLCLTHLQTGFLVVLDGTLAAALLGELGVERRLDHGSAQ